MADIPRILHRVWVGTPVPGAVRTNWEEWMTNPGLEHKLWTDETIGELKAWPALLRLPVFEDPRIFSDYVRLAALLEYGGLYVDSDAIQLRDIRPCFDREWVAGHRSNPYKGGVRILNGAIAARRGHPFLQKIFATGLLNAKNGLTNAHKLAGPHMFMDLYDMSLNIWSVFDILYEAAAKKGDLEYLRQNTSPDAPFVFLGE